MADTMRVCPGCNVRLATKNATAETRCPRCGAAVPPPDPTAASRIRRPSKPAAARPAAAPPPGHPPAAARAARSAGSPDDGDDFAASFARLTADTVCFFCGGPVPQGMITCANCSTARADEERQRQQDAVDRRRAARSAQTPWQQVRRSRRHGDGIPSAWHGRLSKVAGVLILVACAYYATSWVNALFDRTMIGGRTQHEVSEVAIHYVNAKYLSLSASRLPSFIQGLESNATRTVQPGDGRRRCRIESDRGSWSVEGGTLVSDDDTNSRREELPLPNMWFRELGTRGYYRVDRQKPPAIHITSLILREPNGLTWTIKDPPSARSLMNLAVMLGTKEFDGDIASLLNCGRGTLAYSIVFPALNQRLTFDEKIRFSSAGPENVRVMAGEMLVSMLGILPCGPDDPPLPAERYERLVDSMSRAGSLEDKKAAFRRLQGEAPSRADTPAGD